MKITPEVIAARADLRDARYVSTGAMLAAIGVLDNAGLFKEIDEATGYEIDPGPYLPLGDPAEMGDLVAQVSLIANDKGSVVHCTQHGEVSAHPWGQSFVLAEVHRSSGLHITEHRAAQAIADWEADA